jgi:hypothetical protein
MPIDEEESIPLLTGNCLVMEGGLLIFEVHHQRKAVISPKPPLRIEALTAASDPTETLSRSRNYLLVLVGI